MMNRAERRLFHRKGKAKEYLKGLVNRFLSKPEASPMHRGTKVRLNYEKITADPDYARKVEPYKQFVEENRGAIFTVEYDDKYRHDPMFVCLKEDSREVRWLWHVSDLEMA